MMLMNMPSVALTVVIFAVSAVADDQIFALPDGSRVAISLATRHVGPTTMGAPELRKWTGATGADFGDLKINVPGCTFYTYSFTLYQRRASTSFAINAEPSAIPLGEITHASPDPHGIWTDPGYLFVRGVAGDGKQVTVIYEENGSYFGRRFVYGGAGSTRIASADGLSRLFDGIMEKITVSSDGTSVVFTTTKVDREYHYLLKENAGKLVWEEVK